MESDSEHGAEARLALIASSRAALTTPQRGENAYHLLLGLLSGALIATQSTDGPWRALGLLVAAIGIPLLILWWRRSHGWWVSGTSPRSTRWVTTLLVITLVALGIWSFVASTLWVGITAGILAAFVTWGLGTLWMRVWRRDLATDPTATA